MEKTMFKHKELFETLPVPQAVWKLAVPTIIGSLVQLIYNMADTFFVGQTGNPANVAGVTFSMPIYFLLIAWSGIFAIGGGSFIARKLGEGDHPMVAAISSFCFYACLGSSCLITLVLQLASQPLLRYIGAPPETMQAASSYLDIIALAAPFMILGLVFSTMIRNEGAASIATKGLVLGSITNIILDPIFILYFNWGVVGAAWATVLATALSVCYFLYYLLHKATLISLRWQDATYKHGILREVFWVGLPPSLNGMLMGTAAIAMNSLLGQYGNLPIASAGVAMRSSMLVAALQMSFSQGCQPLIGYCYGAGNRARLRETIRFALCCAITVGTTLTILIYWWAPELSRCFLDNDQVVALSTKMIRAFMTSGPLLGIFFISSGTLQALGKAKASLVLSMSRQCLLYLPLMFICNHYGGLQGLYWAQPITDYCAVLLAVALCYYSTRSFFQTE